jgi:glutamine amidotransferase PdxT
MGSRKTMIPKLGKLIYTVSYYEKVKRATMMLSNNNVLMVSFDPEANHDSILINKILPLVKDKSL